ncbi:MAG: hypothetical protein K9W44_11785 [Candidatus Lokiarchaeota archaeon]|nr:hypothetical protein [Candidatus Harpocratesius repetitus]
MNDQIPPATNEKWQALILGLDYKNFEFFPVKLLLARLQLKVKQDPSEENVLQCSKELRQLFVKNQHIPKAKRDLDKIFKKKFNFKRFLRRRR